MMTTELGIVVFALAAAVGAIVASAMLHWHRARRRAVVLASDAGAGPAPMMLRDPRLGLRGKPDYVLCAVERGRPLLVAVELKLTRRSSRVLESDAVQVAAYILLLQATYGDAAAPFGYVRYQSGTRRVEPTAELKRRVEEIVGRIRRDRQLLLVHRSHGIARRCEACAVRAHGDERLA